MQNEQASRTALLIAASLVLLHRDPKYSDIVSKTSADFCADLLETHSSQARLFLKIVRQGWFRPIANLIEQITIPGILLHYALRKKCIGTLARSALINGATQVVVIGAGFDPICLELHRDLPNAQFWELDHPATQRHKLRMFANIGAERVHFVAMDLSANALNTQALIDSGFDPTQRTCWIAEGLLMYLTPEVVSLLMKTIEELSAPPSTFVFTFMEKQTDDRIRFHTQSGIVDWWLRRRGEPFLWGTTRAELVEFARPWRVARFFDHNDLRELEPTVSNECIASGEVICLAEI
ncbi:MAG TPA: SAM-dependent methyltransferase [Candidatus Udaeobacter sp.]|jgi:methyltransferase (TIGR00027 family)|nr:SAM-dependent methyltransferase [Candidatus Udaeobacter sp.]